MTFRSLAFAALCLLAAGANAGVPASDYQALHWRLVGPFRGGRVLAVTGIAGDSRHFYFGAVDGGVWKTDDAGRTWKPIFDSEPVGSIGAIAVAPSAPNVVYVGTGEADMRSDIALGAGVYKSTDAGAHWHFIGLRKTISIGRILVDPANPNIVYVAALGDPYGANPERGVFRSVDGGRHWTKVLYKNANTGAIDLAFKPGDPNTIYAALWQTRRPPWNVYPPSDGPGSGLYVSHDGGSHWSQIIGHGFADDPGRIGIATSPAAPNRVYALVDAPSGEGGLYRSDDNGVHWQHVSRDLRIYNRGWYFGGITADPKDANRVYVMNTIVLRSDDGGAHFIALKGDPTGDDFHQMWIDPTDPNRQMLGVDQGAIITLNGGKTWSSWFNQPTAQIYHVATDNRFPYWVYGAQQDSGAVALPSRTSSVDGITMEEFHEISAGGESGMIAPDPSNPHIIYGGKVKKLNTRTGQTRIIDPTLAYPDTHYRGVWTLPLEFSKTGKKTLYFANQRLFATTDGGRHWRRISPDLTRPDPGIPPNLDPVTARDDDHVSVRKGVIYTIAPSSRNPKLIWVGTDDGLVWKTLDGGLHWTNVTPPALTAWSKVAGIEPSHFNSQVAYLAIDRHRLDDDTPYIYRTRDGGKSWQRVDHGIPQGSFVNVVREDPVNPDLLYAGTEKGVYVSFDAGRAWQSLQQNLPMTSVRDIDVHDNDLVIATHGRGFWIMDDVTALRQMNKLRKGMATLFDPEVAYRVRPGGFAGTPMPKDEPMAANPPDGAMIDYVLPAKVNGAVTLTILDTHNQVVRRFSSSDPVPHPNAATLAYAPEWMVIPPHLSNKPGMQRFVWDLRAAALGAHARADEDGVWMPPGQYTLVLQANGRNYRTSLQVKPDPRVKLSEAAYQRQYALAVKVAEASAQASDALAAAKTVIGSLQARLAESAGTLRSQLRAALSRIEHISNVPLRLHTRNSMGTPPRSLSSLRALSGDLANLEQAVDGADADPSPDALTAYAKLSARLKPTLASWTKFETSDLGKLNMSLKAAGDQVIKP